MTIMANSTDGTSLNSGSGGDVIATEDMPLGAQRWSADVPTTDYKVPRSKLVVGQYGADKGDVSPNNPLAVAMLHERHMLEYDMISQIKHSRMLMSSRGSEKRPDLVDRRGNNGRRGVR